MPPNPPSLPDQVVWRPLLHQLRNLLIGSAQALDRGAAEIGRSSRTGRLLDLAAEQNRLADRGLAALQDVLRARTTEAPEEIDLAETVRTMADRHRAEQAGPAGTRIDLDLPADLSIRAPRPLAELAVGAVLSNAANAGSPVRVTAAKTGGCVRITIHDSGPGFEGDTARLIAPLTGTWPGRPGTGLAVAFLAVHACGGGLTLGGEGHGTVELRFPTPLART